MTAQTDLQCQGGADLGPLRDSMRSTADTYDRNPFPESQLCQQRFPHGWLHPPVRFLARGVSAAPVMHRRGHQGLPVKDLSVRMRAVRRVERPPTKPTAAVAGQAPLALKGPGRHENGWHQDDPSHDRRVTKALLPHEG